MLHWSVPDAEIHSLIESAIVRLLKQAHREERLDMVKQELSSFLHQNDKDPLMNFLLVLQTKLQKKWMTTYGNTVTLMDAIYKTNKY